MELLKRTLWSTSMSAQTLATVPTHPVIDQTGQVMPALGPLIEPLTTADTRPTPASAAAAGRRRLVRRAILCCDSRRPIDAVWAVTRAPDCA